ncbi:HPr kinase/phosphorylase [Cognatishimia sp. SS12]|uniref:HPr kinase/phosphorylase n=1 Tax=Cognatishimia sp. SS12 TaxID=2979465 RepID=UPI003FA49C35
MLLSGPSGSGKSALALELISRGAQLVADDQTVLARDGAQIVAQCPKPISGKIEARGVGILRAVPAGPTPLALWVDLGRVETKRLPPAHTITRLGVTLPLLFHVASPHFPAAIIHYVRYGRSD